MGALISGIFAAGPLAIAAAVVVGILIFFALVCYGISMLRLLFKI